MFPQNTQVILKISTSFPQVAFIDVQQEFRIWQEAKLRKATKILCLYSKHKVADFVNSNIENTYSDSFVGLKSRPEWNYRD
jgi:hypothetical protein